MDSRVFVRRTVVTGVVVAILVIAVAVAVEISNLRAEVRRVAGHFLECPPGEVSLDSWSGGDTWDDFLVSGCGKRGLVTCSVGCAFHAPEGDGYSEIGTVVPGDAPAPEAR